MHFFGLKTCDTCRKALKALHHAGHAPEVTDVRADGIAPADLDAIVSAFGDRAVNRASATWRGLTDAEKAQDIRSLLVAHPTVMKRPVIRQGDEWYLGWAKDTQAALTG